MIALLFRYSYHMGVFWNPIQKMGTKCLFVSYCHTRELQMSCFSEIVAQQSLKKRLAPGVVAQQPDEVVNVEVKRHWNRKWSPHTTLCSDRDARVGRELVEYWCPTNKEAIRVYKEFLAFRRFNGFTIESGIHAWIGQAMRFGITVGTLHTYISHIRKKSMSAAERPRFHPSFFGEILQASKALKIAHADADTTHARDLTDKCLISIQRAIPDSMNRLCTWLLANSPGRAKDLSRLRQKQICFSSKSTTFTFRVMKNRMERGLRFTKEIPCFISTPLKEDITWWSSFSPNDKPFRSVSATSVNKALAASAVLLSLQRPTTYSYRRAYMRAVRRSGLCLAERQALTAHLNPHIADAHYALECHERPSRKRQRS